MRISFALDDPGSHVQRPRRASQAARQMRFEQQNQWCLERRQWNCFQRTELPGKEPRSRGRIRASFLRPRYRAATGRRDRRRIASRRIAPRSLTTTPSPTHPEPPKLPACPVSPIPKRNGIRTPDDPPPLPKPMGSPHTDSPPARGREAHQPNRPPSSIILGSRPHCSSSSPLYFGRAPSRFRSSAVTTTSTSSGMPGSSM